MRDRASVQHTRAPNCRVMIETHLPLYNYRCTGFRRYSILFPSSISSFRRRRESSYVCVMDPLDGYSNVRANVSVGSIFAVYKRSSESDLKENDKQDFTAEGACVFVCVCRSIALEYCVVRMCACVCVRVCVHVYAERERERERESQRTVSIS